MPVLMNLYPITNLPLNSEMLETFSRDGNCQVPAITYCCAVKKKRNKNRSSFLKGEDKSLFTGEDYPPRKPTRTN